MRRPSLNQRFLAYLLLLAVLPLLAVGGLSIQFSRSALEAESRRNVLQEVRDKSALLDVQMAQIEALISNISGVEEIATTLAAVATSADIYNQLATQARIGYVLNNFLNLEGLVSIEIFTLSGKHYHVGETLDVGNIDSALRDQLIQETLARNGGVYWAGARPNINGNSKHRVVLTATRMIHRLNQETSRPESVAMLLVNFDPGRIRRQFADPGLEKNGYMMVLLDGGDRFVLHPDIARLGKKADAQFLATLSGAGSDAASALLVSSAPLRVPQFRFAILVPRDVIERPARAIVRAGALVMLASLLVVGIGAFSFLRRVVYPLREITGRFRQLRSEPDARQAPLSVAGDDEIANLGRGFNDLLGALDARREADQALRLAHERNQQYLDTVQSLMVALDGEGRVTMINRAGLQLLGYQEAELLGCNWFETCLPQPEGMREIYPAFQKIMAGHLEHAASFENTVRRADGGQRLIAWHNAPLRNARGEIIGTLSSGEDITERKRAEEELRLHRDNLEELVEVRTHELVLTKDAAEAANRAKSTFLANMSHELRTPMNAIMGMTDMALRRASDPRQIDQLTKARQGADRLLGIINDILDIAKVEADRLVLNQVNFRLSEVLNNLINLLGRQVSDKGLSLIANLSPGLPSLPLLGDAQRLGQVLLNLTGNALKFTEAGSITLRARLVEDNPDNVLLRMEVVDTGIGISAEALPRLFTAFEQADGSLTRKYGGTGLGLAISKRLVLLMGGAIGVESTPGQGSTFWFNVRLGRATRDDAAAPTLADGAAEARLRARHAGARVLLAEDEPVNQEVSLGLLEDAGMSVDLAADGIEALELAKRNRYELILMDMQMPNLNGVDAARAIRADSLNSATPILAMTANAFEEDRQTCLDAGMNDHVAKPTEPARLFETMLRWLEK